MQVVEWLLFFSFFSVSLVCDQSVQFQGKVSFVTHKTIREHEHYSLDVANATAFWFVADQILLNVLLKWMQNWQDLIMMTCELWPWTLSLPVAWGFVLDLWSGIVSLTCDLWSCPWAGTWDLVLDLGLGPWSVICDLPRNLLFTFVLGIYLSCDLVTFRSHRKDNLSLNMYHVFE